MTYFEQPATLFKGLDTERMSTRRDTVFFERLADALRHAIEKLSNDEKYGAFIRLEADHQKLSMAEVLELYIQLSST